MIHYLHIAYHGMLKDKSTTFDGDTLVAVEKCTIAQLREVLRKILENLGVEVVKAPSITSMTELNEDLFYILHSGKEINIINIDG